MSSLFSFFPSINYKLNGVDVRSKDITLRFIFKKLMAEKIFIYHTYDVKDGERPDVIANKVYDRSDLDWVIMMSNDIYNLYDDWVMPYTIFQNMIKNKYGSYEASTQIIHSYQQILFEATEQTELTTLDIDSTMYETLPIVSRRIISKYDYEWQKNEDKRTIRIIDPQYIPQIEKEAQRILV